MSSWGDRLAKLFSPVFTIYLVCLLALGILGLIRYKKLSPPLKVAVMLTLYWLLSELSSRFVALFRVNNLIVYHIYLVAHYIFVVGVFYRQLVSQRFMKAFMWFSVVVAVLGTPLNMIFFQPWNRLPTNLILIISVFIIALVLFSYKSMLENPKPIPLFRQGQFWFNLGLLFFYSSNFFLFGVHNFVLISGYPSILRTWLFIANMVMIACFFLAFLVEGFSLKKKPHANQYPGL